MADELTGMLQHTSEGHKFAFTQRLARMQFKSNRQAQ